jgi:hypothetical protein
MACSNKPPEQAPTRRRCWASSPRPSADWEDRYRAQPASRTRSTSWMAASRPPGDGRELVKDQGGVLTLAGLAQGGVVGEVLQQQPHAGIPAMSAGRCPLRRCPSPSDAPKAWTSRPSRPKMHVQPSNHHRPRIRRVGPARQKPRRRIDPVEGMEVAALGGVHRLHRERVRREAEVEPRLRIDYFLRESLRAHQHRQGHPERGGDHARSGRCLRRVNHGPRTAPRQGRG